MDCIDKNFAKVSDRCKSALKVESWLSYLKQADEEGFFFSAVSGFTVAAEKSPS